jgi:hypothetical protein
MNVLFFEHKIMRVEAAPNTVSEAYFTWIPSDSYVMPCTIDNITSAIVTRTYWWLSKHVGLYYGRCYYVEYLT